ncbi:hypothetical protein R3P38DRAFT_3269847 [Favolaschia claudopus]|uniref:Uncharacterized protein n=1 Tax=Favolaschia claudopus TaxID=2862362 RepID=A0AAW0BGF5_9AGAR
MRAPLTSSVFLAVVFAVAVCFASANPFELKKEEINPDSPCTVRVWVRAEDLSPNHVSRGELRIKVLEQECANQVASVALRLQLDEFGEFKHLKVWPKVPSSDENTFESTKHSDGMGSDIHAHDDNDGLNDPKLWTIKAEERRAWTTEAILLQDPDLSEPIVTPFTVAVPAVNYPTVVERYGGRAGAALPVGQHSFSALSYRYIATVTFTDGHTENILAGYTAFIQSSKTNASRSAPFTRNVTFETTCTDDNPRKKGQEQRIEKCLPKEQRSVFVAEVTLQSGETVAQGQTLKGRVTIHTVKDGVTTFSEIHVAVDMVSRDRWAEAQTGTDGDSACSMIQLWPAQTQLWSESDYYSSIFPESRDDDSPTALAHIGASGDLTSSNPHFSFEIEIPRQTPMDFISYYSGVENRLQLRLTGLLPVDVVRCMHPDGRLELLEKEEEANAATTEERLWEMWTPIVGEPAVSALSIEYYRTSIMEATLPITIVSSEPSEQAIAHYLSPSGAVSPVLRSGLQMDMPASFPSAKPVFVVEDIANTSARLMQSRFLEWERRVSSMPDYPDPSKNYRKGNYVAVLWKKKIVAEEMGIWPPREGKVVGEGDGQRP